MVGRVQGRTLENYCHDSLPTAQNGLKAGCPLYHTKPENTPNSLLGAIDAAEILRRYKERGCLPSIDEMSAWEFACFDSAEEASDRVQSEMIKPSTQQSTSEKQTPMGELGKGGGAFDNW